MNWLDRINDIELEIITGDGQSFKPLWKEARKNVKYNTEGFDFVGVEGTYVERKKQSGNQFPVLFYFQGEDCIEQARKFEYAARDSRAWTIIHPIYDSILVQPLSLEFDNSVLNISKITGIVWETINWKYPLHELNVKITIVRIKKDIDIRNAEVFENNIDITSPDLTDDALLSCDIIGKSYEILTNVFEKVNILKDLLRSASAAAQNILSLPLYFMQQIQNLINFPFLIKQNIEFKINQVIDNYNDLKDVIVGVNDNNELYAAYSFSLLSTICQIAASPEDVDYNTRQDVLNTIDKIIILNNDIINTFDDISYQPDANLSLQLDRIVNTTVANLYDIAWNARQERSFILEKDNNIVNLAYKYFGKGDENLQKFIDVNILTKDELLQINKGRKLIYYV